MKSDWYHSLNDFTVNSSVGIMKNSQEDNSGKRSSLGLICAVSSMLLFQLNSVFVKQLANYSAVELCAIRHWFSLLLTIPFLIYSKEDPFPKNKIWISILQGSTTAFSLMLRYYSIQKMSFANAQIIFLSVPVFTVVFARIFLKEAFKLITVVSLIISLIGVVIASGNPFEFFNTNDDVITDWKGPVAAVASAVISALKLVILRFLKDIHWSVNLFHGTLITTILASIATLALEESCMPGTMEDWGKLMVMGTLGFAARYLIIKALALEDAGPVAITRTTDIVFAFILQYVFFHEEPTIMSLSGASLVVISVLLIIQQSRKKNDEDSRQKKNYIPC